MASLSELKAEKLINNDQAGVIQHTSKQFLRIYPKASRTDSSNFDPLPFWLSGCQLGGIMPHLYYFLIVNCWFPFFSGFKLSDLWTTKSDQ